ncbi:hypothetical protein DYY67_1211 [Candidatus Nitrosotalea sp. TS]|nr:hypothetical protein [Candidatus Nitrosotalea sp. TS]
MVYIPYYVILYYSTQMTKILFLITRESFCLFKTGNSFESKMVDCADLVFELIIDWIYLIIHNTQTNLIQPTPFYKIQLNQYG